MGQIAISTELFLKPEHFFLVWGFVLQDSEQTHAVQSENDWPSFGKRNPTSASLQIMGTVLSKGIGDHIFVFSASSFKHQWLVYALARPFVL